MRSGVFFLNKYTCCLAYLLSSRKLSDNFQIAKVRFICRPPHLNLSQLNPLLWRPPKLPCQTTTLSINQKITILQPLLQRTVLYSAVHLLSRWFLARFIL
jgi:hypothetical protein